MASYIWGMRCMLGRDKGEKYLNYRHRNWEERSWLVLSVDGLWISTSFLSALSFLICITEFEFKLKVMENHQRFFNQGSKDGVEECVTP